jgi:hypothetical protein
VGRFFFVVFSTARVERRRKDGICAEVSISVAHQQRKLAAGPMHAALSLKPSAKEPREKGATMMRVRCSYCNRLLAAVAACWRTGALALPAAGTFQDLTQLVQLRAKTGPIPGPQPLHGAIVVAESFSGPIHLRGCEHSFAGRTRV